MKILIAEDDLTSRAILQAICTKWGYQPIAVEDGESAWQCLQEADPPRLLLIDWEMPKLDGLALCERIRQQEENHNPPFIILLTARSETPDIVTGLACGANDYIAKPFQNAELHARLQVGERVLTLQSELNQLKHDLIFRANHDALTGLLNRGAIMQALEQELARAKRHTSALCIAMCDIDYFKQVNDSYGHPAGDAVLCEVAQRISNLLRPYDQVGRYGGEEFLILVGMARDDATGLFERIRRVIADTPFEYQQTTLQVTISCGVAAVTPSQGALGQDALLSAADAALYQAKTDGRNRTVFAEWSK